MFWSDILPDGNCLKTIVYYFKIIEFFLSEDYDDPPGLYFSLYHSTCECFFSLIGFCEQN